MLDLILIRGLPYSGKTTVGRNLADGMGYSFIDIDDIKDSILPMPRSFDNEIIKLRSQVVFDTALFLVDNIMNRLGLSVVVSYGFRYKPFYYRIRDFANTIGASFYSFYLSIPLYMTCARAELRPEKDVRHLLDRCISEDSIYDFDVVVDNSESLSNTLNAIKSVIYEKHPVMR